MLGRVDLCRDGGEGVPAPVGVIVGDGLAEALKVGADELGECDEQREVGGGEVDEAFPEVVQRWVGEAGEVGGGLLREQRGVGTRELVFGGARAAGCSSV